MCNEVLEAIKTRRSCRKYQDKPVPEDVLAAVLEAGTWAATAVGRQSPKIVVIRDEETIAKITKMNAAFTGNPEGDPFYHPPMIILVVADMDCCGRDNAIKDGSLVLGNMMLAAHALGLATCWINRTAEELETEEGKALLKTWGIEGNYIGVGHLSIGYADGALPTPKARKADYIVDVK